ncbi:MAG: uroporphyrinogen-III C-methyltransferase [Actinomycetota bacterium]
MTTGRVYLVGAGPGDPDLVTRRGLRALWSCDVVAFDRLVAPELVDEAPPHAERIFVGKAPGGPHVEQEAINDLLVTRASEGRIVVRLKGGDPFVFGRGGEEAEALAARGVPFEVVPGVSSAVAVPAYAGIPVTHRGLSSSFAVLTGRQCADGSDVNWWQLARSVDTLVLLMGVATLRVAALRLIEAGRPSDQPAAVIEWGTTSRQRTIVSTLESIAEEAARAGIAPPATAIVGDVVRLRERIDWFRAAASPVVARP